MSAPQQPGTAAPSALPVTAVNLPLLGSRSNPETTFQYLLQAVDARGATMACPAWLARREHFRPGDAVDLHFPFRTADGWHRHQAEVAEVRRDEEGSGQVCRTVFRDRQPLHHPVFASVDTGEVVFTTATGLAVDRTELLASVLKDCLLQKRGVQVYYKHIVPLFSRLSTFSSAEYGSLRSMLLEDVRTRIEANVAAFERWHRQAADGALSPARDLDLEQVRGAIETEIEGDVFDATFSSAAIQPYLAAIRLLDHKLYLNYNTLVLLYAQGL